MTEKTAGNYQQVGQLARVEPRLFTPKLRDGNYSLFILPVSHFLSETAAQQRGAWLE